MIYSNNLIKLFISWQIFSLGLCFKPIKKDWVDLLELEVQEMLTHLELLDVVKQVLCVLDRKINRFTCCITSTIQENNDVFLCRFGNFLQVNYGIMVDSLKKTS